MFEGSIGEYEWVEWREKREEIAIYDLIAQIKPILKGLYALNTSFDSGLFAPKESDIQQGWSRIGDRAVSPLLTETILDNLPNGVFDDGFNEWYFFCEYPTDCPQRAFCNWLGLSVENHKEVKFSHDFEGDIHRCLPEFVIGEGNFLYLIYKPIYREEIFKNLSENIR